jgi:hypothetical protein
VLEFPLSSVVADVMFLEPCGCQWVKFSHRDGDNFWWLFRGNEVVCTRGHEEPRSAEAKW